MLTTTSREGAAGSAMRRLVSDGIGVRSIVFKPTAGGLISLTLLRKTCPVVLLVVVV
jgi:hypothetical protein